MKKDYLRMIEWLAIAVMLYILAALLASSTNADGTARLPQVQIVLWKLGHITLASFAGYWIDRTLFRERLVTAADPIRQLRRAIIVAGAMLAVSLGL